MRTLYSAHPMHVHHHLLLPRVVLERIGQLDDAVAVRPDGEGAGGLHYRLLHYPVLVPPRVELVVRVDDAHDVTGSGHVRDRNLPRLSPIELRCGKIRLLN